MPTNEEGDSFNVIIDKTSNQITFAKSSTGQTFYVTYTDPTQTRMLVWYNENGILTLDYSPTYFLDYYDPTNVSYSGYEISFAERTSIYSPTLDQFAYTSCYHTITSISDWICMGIMQGSNTVTPDPAKLGHSTADNTAFFCAGIANSFGGFNLGCTSSSSYCVQCNSACSSCTDGTATACESCASGYFLQPSSTTCLTTCPTIGYYGNTNTNNCESNHSNYLYQ